MSNWKAYDEVHFSNEYILRWVREGDEYVSRITCDMMDDLQSIVRQQADRIAELEECINACYAVQKMQAEEVYKGNDRIAELEKLLEHSIGSDCIEMRYIQEIENKDARIAELEKECDWAKDQYNKDRICFESRRNELEKDIALKTRDRDVFRDFTLAYEKRIEELEKDLKKVQWALAQQVDILGEMGWHQVNKDGYTTPQTKPLSEAIQVVEQLRVDADLNYKGYEDTYADGWDDAFNEILSALYKKDGIK